MYKLASKVLIYCTCVEKKERNKKQKQKQKTNKQKVRSNGLKVHFDVQQVTKLMFLGKIAVFLFLKPDSTLFTNRIWYRPINRINA